MHLAVLRKRCLVTVIGAATLLAAPANAGFLFWYPPSFTGAPVRGDEPGIAQAFPGATDKELRSNLLWNMRAGLNVAALQCQFAPALQTVPNYNDLLKQHGKELADAYTTLTGYFKRTDKKGWQVKLDQYTTRTYQGFSTMHAQLGFCDTAGNIGREALSRPKGKLYLTAETRMREFRNSLVPMRDRLFAMTSKPMPRAVPPLDKECWDKKKNTMKKKCWSAAPQNEATAQLTVDASALN